MEILVIDEFERLSDTTKPNTFEQSSTQQRPKYRGVCARVWRGFRRRGVSRVPPPFLSHPQSTHELIVQTHLIILVFLVSTNGPIRSERPSLPTPPQPASSD